jgi:hypothetical protein
MTKNQKIKLDCDCYDFVNKYKHSCCTFNLEDDFILYNDHYNIIYIYSTQTKNNKWRCKRMYRLPKGFNLISMSKYDKLYLFSNNSIYEWNLITEKSIKVFAINEEIKYDKVIDKISQIHLKIFHN